MRIAYYIPGWPPGAIPNGIVTTLGYLGQQLRELGHEVFYITPVAEPDLKDSRVLVLDQPPTKSLFQRMRFRWDFEAALFRAHSNAIAAAACRLVRDYDIDILQMEETHGWASTVIRRVPIPVVVRLHGPWFLQRDLGHEASGNPENRHRVDREGAAILDAVALTAPSKAVFDLTTAHYGSLRNLKAVIPNPMRTKPPSLRWDIEKCDRNLILFVGRFDRIKGADLVLKSFVKVAKDRPLLRLLFVGPDLGLVHESSGLVNFSEFCEKEIPEQLRSRVEYRGLLTRHEIESLRTMAYLTVVASRYETFPNVVIEAMSAGCPIVATNVGGIPEVTFHNRNGLLASTDNVDDLSTAISHVLESPTLASELGSQAALDCGDWFAPEMIARRTLDFYSSVIELRQNLNPRP